MSPPSDSSAEPMFRKVGFICGACIAVLVLVLACLARSYSFGKYIARVYK